HDARRTRAEVAASRTENLELRRRLHLALSESLPRWTPALDPSGELAALHRAYAATRDRAVRDQLMSSYDDYALSLARQFPSRREAPEDLGQVARIGLLHAIDRFDPTRGQHF